MTGISLGLATGTQTYEYHTALHFYVAAVAVGLG